ncbi:hypothetical protein RJ639_034571 [Escallonia herrerae]|uniref:type I protein arginine methyltransferase n=1 Tax=Escallonia herrerae TaxID=1293975 RepID=A0AA88X1I1_9ASTE|nr:hypothetical protein RJ639_034571 [Escallonia herrerae]
MHLSVSNCGILVGYSAMAVSNISFVVLAAFACARIILSGDIIVSGQSQGLVQQCSTNIIADEVEQMFSLDKAAASSMACSCGKPLGVAGVSLKTEPVEIPQRQNEREREFLLASMSQLPSTSSPSFASPVARFFLRSGIAELHIHEELEPKRPDSFDLRTTQLFKLSPVHAVCISASPEAKEKTTYSTGILIQFRNEKECSSFSRAFEREKNKVSAHDSDLPNKILSVSKSTFDEKTDPSSAEMYFHYYGQLLHQQNMLEDYVRTGTYYAAVTENQADFVGRVVVDVGAGSGILSLFAAQAGAKHVYAVEASEMAAYASKLIAGNPLLSQRITVAKGKVEEVELPEKADILISEPMGTLLVNERMLESYVIARDRFLVPNGKMFPTLGRMHMAPFCDQNLYDEIANKALFWQQQAFYKVDLTPLHEPASQEYFSQPVVDAFDERLLVAQSISHMIDFKSVKEEDLYEIDIPLRFICTNGSQIHGLACWFDVLFNGSTTKRWLTTAPGEPTTHWYQVRCVLSQPLDIMPGQEITGRLHMMAHSAQSYIIHVTMSTELRGPGAEQGGNPQTSSAKCNLNDPYLRMLQPQGFSLAQDHKPHRDGQIQSLIEH